MASNEPLQAREIRAAATVAIHRHWGLFLFEGILLVVLGIAAVMLPTVASITATIFFGWILLLSGILGLFSTLRASGSPGFGWSLFSALTGIIAGGVLLWMPVQGTLSLTAVLIAFLFIEGVASILFALDHRKGWSGRWTWMLVSGIVDVFLGVMLLAGLPGTAAWALGLLLGVNLIFGGTALAGMALHARDARAGGDAAAGPL
jgi:uncharacterized membrane protein HdeD (DUF308 family)